MKHAVGVPVFFPSRPKFPSGGGVAQSAGVVLRVRNIVKKDHLPATRYSSTGGELGPQRERAKFPSGQRGARGSVRGVGFSWIATLRSQ